MKIWKFNLRHLSAAAEVWRCGSVSAASRAVNLTQPALTQGLAKLEMQLGVSLFERTTVGMSSLPAAKILGPRIEGAIGYIASSRVTMSQMRALIVFSQCGSYPAASLYSGISQPSLHRSIADLSVALQLSLTERRGQGVALTQHGKQTVRGFRLACGQLEAGLDEVKNLKGLEGGRIVIGAMPLSRARILPAAVSDFYQKHPHVEIVIVEGSHHELIEPLRDGEIDILIGALRDPSPGNDVIQEPLFDDRPVILARGGHPLTDPSIRDLTNYPWIISAEGTPLRTKWELMFDQAKLGYPTVPIECGSVMTIRQILMQTDFLTMLSSDQVMVELEAGWLRKVCDVPDNLLRVIGLTTRSAWMPTKIQVAFIDILKKFASPIIS